MKLFLSLILLLIILVLAFSYYAYRMAFYMPPRPKDQQYALPPGMTMENMNPGIRKSLDRMLAVPFEPVTITSFDGKHLFGRYYHVQDGAPVQIQFHGYKGSALVEMSGGNYLARCMDQNTLTVDHRSHGKSDGNTITFGIKERRDVLCWIQYVCERFGKDTPIILSGISMGAATVLMAADLDLPSNVKGIIADCPYSTPKDIILKTCGDMKYPPALTYPFIKLGARLFGHFNLEETSAVGAVQKARVPILIIHGENDHFVPCEMSREIIHACASAATLVTFPDAGHGRSYLMNPKRYEKEVQTFINNSLK